MTSKAVVATPSSSKELQIQYVTYGNFPNSLLRGQTELREGNLSKPFSEVDNKLPNSKKKYLKFNQKLVTITLTQSLSTHGKLKYEKKPGQIVLFSTSKFPKY